MSISNELYKAYTSALKEKNQDYKLYSYYLSCAKKVEKDGGSEDDVIKALQKELKELKIVKDALSSGRTQEEKEKTIHEIELLEKFLPSQLTEEEIEEIVSEAFEELFSGRTVSPKEKGSVMKCIRPAIAGRADGKLVNMIVNKYMEKYS